MRYLVRTWAVAAAVLALAQFLSSSASAQVDPTPTPDTPATPDAEVRELREQVRLLTERLEKAEQRIAELEKPDAAEEPEELGGIFPGGFKQKGVDRKALAQIKLPDQPTRAQAEEYVDAILHASRGQTMYSDSDPQVRMLAAVGPQHADVLVDRVEPADHYIVSALRRVVTDEHRDLIIGTLGEQPDLVAVVLDKGWEAQAKNELLALLKRRPPHLPPGVVEAVAGFEDPATYPLLLDWLARGTSPAMTYPAIAGLPGIELDDAVAKAWTRIQRGGGWPFGAAMRQFDLPSFAPIAASHGHRDALDALAGILRKGGAGPIHHFETDQALQGLRSVLDFEGDDDELLPWYDEHKDALRWDEAKRQFVVPAAKVG